MITLPMSKRAIVFLCVAAVLIVASCRREALPPQEGAEPGATTATTTAPPQDLANARVNAVIEPQGEIYLERARLGSALGQDGMVANEKTEFTRGEQVQLSMWFRESPQGLQASAVLEDGKGKELSRQQKPMDGQRTVTFAVGDSKLARGKYKVTGYWGGNIAAEYEFTVK